jgi:aspartate kinase
MMQTSALSFTVCLDLYEERFKKLLHELGQNFKAKYNENLSLITLRHYSSASLKELTDGKTILLEQISRNTVQLVVKM